MYRLIQAPGALQNLAAEAPPLAGAMAIAERFYRFHSFTLECAAFLPTWYALSFLLTKLLRAVERGRQAR